MIKILQDNKTKNAHIITLRKKRNVNCCSMRLHDLRLGPSTN